MDLVLLHTEDNFIVIILQEGKDVFKSIFIVIVLNNRKNGSNNGDD